MLPRNRTSRIGPRHFLSWKGSLARVSRCEAASTSGFPRTPDWQSAYPSFVDEIRDTDAGRFLRELSARTPPKGLDELISKLDRSSERIDELKNEEHSLRTMDTRRERRNLTRQAEKLGCAERAHPGNFMQFSVTTNWTRLSKAALFSQTFKKLQTCSLNLSIENSSQALAVLFGRSCGNRRGASPTVKPIRNGGSPR